MRSSIQGAMISLAAAAVLTSCASGPSIRSNVDPAADFSRYKTFAFFDEATGKKAAYEPFVTQYIKEAVQREMEARGLPRQKSNPDLLVNVHVQAKDKMKVHEGSASYGGYYGYRSGYYGWSTGVPTTVENYTEGTLNVDVVDRATSKLVWEGIAVGKVSDKTRDNMQTVVDAVVKQVYEKFPRQPPGAPAPGAPPPDAKSSAT